MAQSVVEVAVGMGIVGFTDWGKWKRNGSSKKQVFAAVQLQLCPAPDIGLFDISDPLRLPGSTRLFA